MEQNIRHHEKNINLKIGDVLVLEKKAKVIWSVLGSCISVIFFVKDKISIISHAQIPYSGLGGISCRESCPKPCGKTHDDKRAMRYVKCSIEYMIEVIKEKKINIRDVEVTVIGGASLFSSLNNEEKGSIGDQNVYAALRTLEENKLKISRKYVGGNHGLTLWYHTDSNQLEVMKHNDKTKYVLHKPDLLKPLHINAGV